MRSKMMLAALMVGSLVLAGCSGNDNENPPTLTGTGTATTALLNQSDVVIKDKNGATVTTVKVAGGKYHFNSGLLKAENAPFTVSVTGGVMLNGANSPFTGPLLAVSGMNSNIDVNIATKLTAMLFQKLSPAERLNVNNIAKVQTKVGQLISEMVFKIYGVTPNMNAVFGAPNAYSEQILLAVLGGTLATQDGTTISKASLVSLEQSANLTNLVNTLVPGTTLDLADNAGFVASINTLVAGISATEIASIKTVVYEVLVTNLPAMVSAGLVTQAVADTAIKDAKDGKLTQPPVGTPDPKLLFSWLLYSGNESQVISEWHLNNSSTVVYAKMKGAVVEKGNRYDASGLTFSPSVSGLTVKPSSSPNYFELAYSNASTKITANQSVNLLGTFPGQTGSHSASTLNYPFKVVYNGSAGATSKLVFVNASVSPVELP